MVGYFGSKGDRLRITRNINQPVNGVRPYPTLSPTSPILPGAPLGNITETDSLGWSHYKGLWLTANQRPSKGLQFNASYTLAKSTDTNSLSTAVIVVQDSNNIADSEGPSDFDVRHRFVDQRHLRAAVHGQSLKSTAGSCRVVTQAQTGSPVNIVTGINTFNGVNNTLRPDLVGDPSIIGSVDAVVQQHRVRSAHRHRGRGVHVERRCSRCRSRRAAPSISAILARNAVFGPGFSNTDFSVIKNLRPVGTARLQFRIEVFNLFNQANLGLPGRIATVGSTSFGVITNTRFPTGDSGSARQVQFAIKALF